MRIVVPDLHPPSYQGHPQLARLQALGEVYLHGDQPSSQDDLIERLSGATIAINMARTTRFSPCVLSALPCLEFISVRGYDTDQIDLETATAHGVVVSNTPGAPSTSVAEMGIALMFAATRHVALADRRMREGQWLQKPGMELRGKTIGILGLGSIGLEMARIARGIGMRVIAWSPTHDTERAESVGAQLVDRDDLLRGADVVSMCLRVFPETIGCIGRRELALMKPTAVLINVARAALVDEDALIEALQEKRIAAAGLDVYAREPLPPDHPLLTIENVVLSPHSAWYTAESIERLMAIPVDNIIAYLSGAPRRVVNEESLNHPRPRQRVSPELGHEPNHSGVVS